MQDDDEEIRVLISAAVATVGRSQKAATAQSSPEGSKERTTMSRVSMPPHISAVQVRQSVFIFISYAQIYSKQCDKCITKDKF